MNVEVSSRPRVIFVIEKPLVTQFFVEDKIRWRLYELGHASIDRVVSLLGIHVLGQKRVKECFGTV